MPPEPLCSLFDLTTLWFSPLYLARGKRSVWFFETDYSVSAFFAFSAATWSPTFDAATHRAAALHLLPWAYVQVILKRLFMARRFRPPISVAKIARFVFFFVVVVCPWKENVLLRIKQAPLIVDLSLLALRQ
jgi:hypothetical protein